MNDLEVFVSSMAFGKTDVRKMISISESEHFALEFSSGLPHRWDMNDIFLNAPVKKILHNYFPAPRDPFVLNLASKDEGIRLRSIQHCLQGLDLTYDGDAAFFAAHAGFCLDPKPDELGRKIDFTANFDKAYHIELFKESLLHIQKDAAKKSIGFLIENNVLSPVNFTQRINPLLCVTGEEINIVLSQFDRSMNLGLLLDTAHLKVSCRTLELSLDREMEMISPFIKAIHHSDNNGEIDSNEPLNDDYWFLPFMKQFRDVPHVLEVKNQSVSEINRQIRMLNEAAN